MQGWIQKYVTTEGLFSVSGALWFIISALFPVIPAVMPVPAMPPFLPFELSITPGLLVAISLVPILIKMVVPGKTPFIGTGASVTVASGPVELKENQDA